MSAWNTSYQSHWFLIISGRRAWTHLSLQVRSDPDDTSLDGHHEGEADDSSDLQQSLLTQTPATLIRTTHLHQTHDDESSVMMSSIMMSSVMMSWLRTCSSPGRPARRCAGRQSWLSCCWSPGRTELYGGCWRPPRPAPTRRRRTPAGARRSPTPAAWSLRVWSVWTPEQHETYEWMNPADLRDHWAEPWRGGQIQLLFFTKHQTRLSSTTVTAFVFWTVEDTLLSSLLNMRIQNVCVTQTRCFKDFFLSDSTEVTATDHHMKHNLM